jgi:RNA polymerase sigma-70 factor (ECF subfamily)
VLGGDREAYGDLYDRHAPVVRAICHHATRDLAHAQDLAQEVFLKAYCNLGNLRAADRFAAWLVGIARNECRDWLRRRSRDRHEYVARVPDLADGEAGDEDVRTATLLEALRSIPERERLALNAFYLRGESAEAVRALLGLSTSGVYRLLERARQRLAAVLAGAQEVSP